MENKENKKHLAADQQETFMQITSKKMEPLENSRGRNTETQGFKKPVIDEQAIMEMIAGEQFEEKQLQPEPMASRVKKNGPKSGKVTKEMYQKRFFKIPVQAASKGKSVYLRQEHHQKFSRLISVLGVEKLTIYAYVDNIIEHHFREFEELISAIYQEKHKPLF